MINKKLILVAEVCKHYELEISFINSLQDVGLIDLVIKQNNIYIQVNQLADLEKMIRLYTDLEINPQGLDIIFNLLHRIHVLQQQILVANDK
jgi:MerR HTH family regulatory protein